MSKQHLLTVLQKSQMYNDDQNQYILRFFCLQMNCYKKKKSKINNALSYRIGIPNFLTSPNDYIIYDYTSLPA